MDYREGRYEHMADVQLSLSDQERAYLGELLERALKETRIEEHRTRSPSYREHVLHDEALMEGLLAKLGRPVK
jgi:hypothetical protein